MGAAGVLIVRSFAAEEKSLYLAGDPWTFAHVVALGPMSMRKEHTSTKWLNFVLECGLECSRLGSTISPNFRDR
jgi:hypothetical protein